MKLRYTPAALLLALGLMGGAAAQTTYGITDLGIIPGADRSAGWSVTSNGQVAGYTEVYSSTYKTYILYHAFRWTNGSMVDLGTLGGSYSRAWGINEAGYVVGEARIKGSGAVRAFLHDGARMIDITGKNSSYAYGVNNLNRVVGEINGRAFTWSGGQWSYLPGLAGSTGPGTARAVNDSHVIAGNSTTAGGSTRAVVWQNGVISALPLPPGDWLNSSALAINNQGVVAGSVWRSNVHERQPALWRNGVPELVALPANTYGGTAYGASAAGSVITVLDTDPAPNSMVMKAFFWDGSAWVQPGALVDPTLGWGFGYFSGISENGNLTGIGGHPPGVGRAFLMTPAAP